MRAVRWLLYTVGIGMIGFGSIGLVFGARSNPFAWLRFAATVTLLNDGLLTPLVIATGFLLGRVIPLAHRRWIGTGLGCTGALTLVAAPFVLGYGRTADNPSALQLNYGHGLLIVLSLLWTSLGLGALVSRMVRSRRAQRSS
jgi:hypothetical protein